MVVKPLTSAAEVEPRAGRAVAAAVEEGFAAQMEFLERLVSIPSVRGKEAPAQQFLAAELRARGLEVDEWRIEVEAIRDLPGFSPVSVDYADAVNVVGTYAPPVGGSGRSLILNGHVDVVPAGPDHMWSAPPFVPRLAAGRMYGRGVGDMKAGLAAELFAFDAVRRAGFVPSGRIHLQSVVEEESTGNGSLACLQRGYRADAVLIAEPTSGRFVRAQVGVIWCRVTVRGVAAHVLDAGKHGNAIVASFPIIAAIHKLGEDWSARARENPLFASIDEPISVNVGRIEGGDWPSSVPSSCEFDVRIGTYPGQDLAEARREIEEAVAAVARSDPSMKGLPAPAVTFRGFMAEGFIAEENSDPLQVLRLAHRAVTGEPLQEMTLTATTDARIFGLYGGMPTLVYGHEAQAIHGVDESVDLLSLRRTTEVIALFILEWCGCE